MLPFKESSIDAIIITEVLEHLLNPVQCLENIFHCLKPGGYAIFTVPIRTEEQRKEKKLTEKQQQEYTTKMLKHPYAQLLNLEADDFTVLDDVSYDHTRYFMPPHSENDFVARERAMQELCEPIGFTIEKMNLVNIICVKIEKSKEKGNSDKNG